jgi:aspartate/methionine/tyrosine aminotransferase
VRQATRMDTIGTESAFEVSARARALEATGRSIIHLQIGEPDFDTPANVREAAKRALDEGATHYAPYPGIPQLREAIAEDATARKGFAVTPDRVFVTVGGKGVMLYAILGLIDPGDEAIVPDPGYPIYESLVRFVGGTPVPIPIRMSNDFRLDVDELASLVTPRTKMIVINSPANPTGGVLTRGDLERIADIAARHDLVVLADEIYGRILYDGTEHVSIAALPGMAERTIVLDGFSKTFAMTGWRLGYAIVPPWLVQTYGQLVINTISCAPTFAQVGAVEALRGPQDDVDAMVVEFRARRDLVVDGLNAIPGIRCLRPSGAFYAFPDISGTGLGGAELAERLLHEAGVCVLAGTAFGGVGTDHVRISYANSRENLREALARIGAFVAGLPAAAAAVTAASAR